MSGILFSIARLSSFNKPQLVKTSIPLAQNFFISTATRVFAGHSHWQNVRHIKEAKDKEKSYTSSKFGRMIQHAIRIGGSRDPKLNSSLASAMQDALAAKVPKATVERFLNNDTYTDPYVIEAKAAGGIFLLFESCNKHAKRERDQLVSILKKYNCELNVGGIAKEFFSYKGFILIESDEDRFDSLDSATEVGIEVGAEDVELVEFDEKQYYQLQVGPNEIVPISSELEKMGVTICNSEDRYIPLHRVQVPGATAESLDEMYSRIRSGIETIDRIFDNVEIVSNS